MTQVAWEPLVGIARQVPGASVHKSLKQVRFPGGGSVRVYSGDNNNAMRGISSDLAVLDEAAYLTVDTWTHVVRPALSDRQGRALFISTPRTHDWFYNLFLRGQDKRYREWASWQFPTASNPLIPQAEIESAREALPERVFAREYLAEPLDDVAVFRGVDAARKAERQEGPKDGHQYVMGCDFGKIDDYTVCQVIDITDMAVADVLRFNRISYPVQADSVSAFWHKWQPAVALGERNSIGEAMLDMLREREAYFTPFVTTNATKISIIENLIQLIETGRLQLLADDDITATELKAFEMTSTPSGLVKYAAPSGYHDDCVMSLALAASAARDAGPLVYF